MRSMRVRGTSTLPGQRARRRSERHQEFLAQNLSGVHGWKPLAHRFFPSSVVVRDLDRDRAFRRPHEADPDCVMGQHG